MPTASSSAVAVGFSVSGDRFCGFPKSAHLPTPTKNRPYSMRSIRRIIIHCSASPNGRNDTIEDIDRWHKERGFNKVGYHHVIHLDGSTHEGRPEEEQGAHALGYNTSSIGICLIGNDKFTEAQWFALAGLVRYLQEKYRYALVIGHGDLPDVHKECPGFSVPAWSLGGMKALEGHVL